MALAASIRRDTRVTMEAKLQVKKERAATEEMEEMVAQDQGEIRVPVTAKEVLAVPEHREAERMVETETEMKAGPNLAVN